MAKQLRDSKGRYVSNNAYSTQDAYSHGANRGNQTWTGFRNIAAGVELNLDSIKQLLADPAVLKAVTENTEAMLQNADSLSITDGAEYGMIVYNNRPELGPVGVLFCDNYLSVLDDAHHGTLHKVLAGWVGKGH